jgi:hypothetical protein
MEEIVKLVSEKAGISPDVAKTAVNTVFGFLKTKYPVIGSQLDGLMSGGGAKTDMMGKAAGTLGDMLGKK